MQNLLPAADQAVVSNRTFDELRVGDTASSTRVLTRQDIELFAIVSGDVNPAHLDPSFAESQMFAGVVAHGMWGGVLISAVLGTELPGPGTIYLGQDLRFCSPVHIGDAVTTTIILKEKRADRSIAVFDCTCTNQHGKEVIAVRGLSLSHAPFPILLLREVLTGAAIGAALGILAVLGVWIGFGDWRIAVCVGISLFAAGALASAVGLILPWLLGRFGIDPALGSGPVATIVQDVLTLLVYFAVLAAILQ
jgi:acyl dehydratase